VATNPWPDALLAAWAWRWAWPAAVCCCGTLALGPLLFAGPSWAWAGCGRHPLTALLLLFVLIARGHHRGLAPWLFNNLGVLGRLLLEACEKTPADQPGIGRSPKVALSCSAVCPRLGPALRPLQFWPGPLLHLAYGRYRPM